MRPEINVTPLIDVMLVLLIVFMVVSPTPTRGIDARIPALRSGGPSSGPSLVVTVEADAFRLNHTPLATASALSTMLQERLQARADRTVFVTAVEGVTYGRVMEAVDAARGAGADRIGMLGAIR
jgi:biopolymer transport protein ExbD